MKCFEFRGNLLWYTDRRECYPIISTDCQGHNAETMVKMLVNIPEILRIPGKFEFLIVSQIYSNK